MNIPVIVAGGIASGKQLLAAVALGADGVQVGTILLASHECPIHQNYKNAIIKAKDTDTTVTGRIAGTPVRILKNKMARTYIKKEKASQASPAVNDDPIGLQENSEENLFQTGLEFVDVRLMLEPEVAAMAATNADYTDC